MKLSTEELKKQTLILEELREYYLEETKNMLKKEYGPLKIRVFHKLKQKLHLYPHFEKRTFALFNFTAVTKYLCKKHEIIGKSITLEMIDNETVQSLKEGASPYIDLEQKVKKVQKKIKTQRH